MNQLPAALVTIAFFGLLYLLVKLGLDASSLATFKDVVAILAGLFGVAIGAIPSYWFHVEAKNASDAKNDMETRLRDKEDLLAQALVRLAPDLRAELGI